MKESGSASLQKGIWYASSYYEKLKELAQTDPSARMRLETVRNLNRFYHPYPPKHFDLCSDQRSPSGYSVANIILKKGSLPSEALEGIVTDRELGILDCCKVFPIGQYHALYRVLGKEKFDKLFSHQTGSSLVLERDYGFKANPLMPFLQCIRPKKGAYGNRAVAVGQRIGFKNVEDYKAKHQLIGRMRMLQCHLFQEHPRGEQKYVGLGINTEGMDEEEIDALMLEEHNKPPLSCEPLSDSLIQNMRINKEQNLAYCALMQAATEENKAHYLKVLQESGVTAVDAQQSIEYHLDLNVPLQREKGHGNPILAIVKI